MGSSVQAETGQSRKSAEGLVLCDRSWSLECFSLLLSHCLVCWWSGPHNVESQYNAIAQLSELPRTPQQCTSTSATGTHGPAGPGHQSGLLTHCDISDHNFLTFSSRRRTAVCSSAPQSATPFLKRKSLSPKVITQCTLITSEICVYTFKICKMYFCNIISNLCN